MAIQMEKKTFPEISRQSIMLAKQARMEQQEKGHITVICPKMSKAPKNYSDIER